MTNYPHNYWWRDFSFQERFGIPYVTNNRAEKFVVEKMKSGFLICTRCGQSKEDKEGSYIPKVFYQKNIMIKLFMDYCERHNYPYAILSDLIGIQFFDETLDWYDIHPTELSKEQIVDLGKIIFNKVRKRGYNGIIYYANPIKRNKTYFLMLMESGLDRYFISKLPSTLQRII